MVVSSEAKKAQSVHPTKKTRPHCEESFTWQNGFIIFKNITSYFKIHMAKSQTHERIHPSYHRHKTYVLVLYTTQSFRAVCAISCWSSWCRPHTIMSFLKSGFRFHFFLRHRNPFESHAHTPTRELARQKYWFYCGLLVLCTSTVKIAKNHLLVYEIAFVAFERDSKNAAMTALYF